MNSNAGAGKAEKDDSDNPTVEGQSASYFASFAANSPYRPYQWYLDGYLTPESNAYGANVDKISAEYTGTGVKVGIIDTGFDLSTADLGGRFDLQLSYDPRDAGPSNITPDSRTDSHGTLVAGVIGASGQNNVGTVGVASGATLVGYYARFGFGGSTGGELAGLLARQVNVDVSNNSWGYNGAFSDNFLDPNAVQLKNAILTGVTDGRDGLGTNYVFAAGNDRQYVANTISYDGDNTNYHSLTNSRLITTVAASDSDGHITSFSRPGASILVTAPGQWIATTTPNDGDGNLADDVGFASGTSFAAPVVSGVIAMMLEANTDLGYRDVQEILALSSRKIDPAATSWAENGAANWNGGGNLVSHDFGFGLVDAHAAVRLAETWTTVHTASNESVISIAGTVTGNSTLVDFQPIPYTVQVSDAYRDFSIDWVEVDVSLLHTHTGDLRIELISPTGTHSVLLDRPTGGQNPRDNLTFTFSTTHDWGESPVGDWTLVVSDEGSGGSGSLAAYALRFYGDDEGANDSYYYTDEFAALSGDRTTVADITGTDTLNAAAVTSNLVLDLMPGADLTIAGRVVHLGADTLIENAYAGDGDDLLLGNAANNYLWGGAGNDVLDGKAGSDTLVGGAGADLFLYEAGDGADTIADFSIASGDTLDLSGAHIATLASLLALAKQHGTNTVVTLAGGDILTLAGMDGVQLAAASFIFAQSHAPSEIVLSNNVAVSGSQTGTVIGSLSTRDEDFGETLSYHLLDDHGGLFAIEGVNLVFAGTSVQPGSFDVEVQVIDSQNNVLRESFAIAALDPNAFVASAASRDAHAYVGGSGSDLYYVSNSEDTIFEHPSGGFDTVHAAVSYTLSNNIESLELMEEAGSINGTGNSANDKIVGNSGNNTLDGGAGADALIGGAGNDNYFIDHAGDVATEYAGEGVDTVVASISYQLTANIENLVLNADAGAISGAGNALDNVIAGNSSNNIIDGGEGSDTVDYAASTHGVVVSLSINAASGLDIGTDQLTKIENVIGGSGNDTLSGNDAANILFGNAGIDTMAGRAGDDVYHVDNVGDVAIENANEGHDVVNSSVNYTLSANFELLILLEGAGNINGTGNDVRNVLVGNSASNILDGGGGNDHMAGGAGDDIYFIDTIGDIVVEGANGGTDIVYSLVDYALPINVEMVALIGTAKVLSFDYATSAQMNFEGTAATGQVVPETHVGVGNELDNLMIGGAGNDTFFAGEGLDTLTGGNGDDVLVANTLQHLFTQDHDILSGGAGNDRLYGEGADTLNGGGGFDVLQVINDFSMNLDLVATSIEYVVSGFGNDIYTAASGSTSVEVYGSGGDDQITGGSGNDNLWAGVGNDALIGNDGNDLLVGDLGADSLSGGVGNDRLYIDIDDTLIDGGSGFDAAYIATGTGVTLNMATSHLEWVTDFAGGNDKIDGSGVGVNLDIYGGGGNDSLIGGSGSDLIFAGSGNDTVVGGSGDDAIVGEAGADSLSGGTGNDRLYVDSSDTLIDGGTGMDAVYIEGGAGLTLNMATSSIEFIQDNVGGNDNMEASATLAGVTVDAGAGTDIVSGGSGADVLAGGSGDDMLSGNGGGDKLFGDAGQDRLIGGTGHDELFGGLGADTFVWTDHGNTDTIQDWQHGIDALEFHGIAGLNDFNDLTIVADSGNVDIYFGVDKLFVLTGVSHVAATDCLFT